MTTKQGYTSILGVKVSSTTYSQTLFKIKNWIDNKKKEYICVSNVHSIMECQKDKKLLNGVNRSGVVTPDGVPLVWLSKLYGSKTERVYGPTLLNKLCRLSEKNVYKVIFLGGSTDSLKRLAKKISKLYPKLKVVGYIETPIRPIPDITNKQIIKKINFSKAQLVFVGLGCPHQEYWMIENQKNLNANILIGVGAAFDFISGKVRQAPPWIQKIGFEWLFRLTREPKRLWYRYTTTNILFIYKITGQLYRHFFLKKNDYYLKV